MKTQHHFDSGKISAIEKKHLFDKYFENVKVTEKNILEILTKICFSADNSEIIFCTIFGSSKVSLMAN